MDYPLDIYSIKEGTWKEGICGACKKNSCWLCIRGPISSKLIGDYELEWLKRSSERWTYHVFYGWKCKGCEYRYDLNTSVGEPILLALLHLDKRLYHSCKSNVVDTGKPICHYWEKGIKVPHPETIKDPCRICKRNYTYKNWLGGHIHADCFKEILKKNISL